MVATQGSTNSSPHPSTLGVTTAMVTPDASYSNDWSESPAVDLTGTHTTPVRTVRAVAVGLKTDPNTRLHRDIAEGDLLNADDDGGFILVKRNKKSTREIRLMCDENPVQVLCSPGANEDGIQGQHNNC